MLQGHATVFSSTPPTSSAGGLDSNFIFASATWNQTNPYPPIMVQWKWPVLLVEEILHLTRHFPYWTMVGERVFLSGMDLGFEQKKHIAWGIIEEMMIATSPY